MSKDFENIKNNEINKEVDKKKLLEELALDIANKFGIDKNEVEKLIKSETLLSLDSLKTELNKDIHKENNLNNGDIEKLFFTLKGALEVIENSSKLEIKILKDDVEKSINIEDFKNHIEDYLPAEILAKAKNPQNTHEHILGFALGTTNSIIATVDILYQIGKGILLSPYHIYMILSSKAKTDSFKNI